MHILGIESSCDDTAVAIIKERKIISHNISSQIDLHRPFGGVVPEIAARSHVEVIDDLVNYTISDAKINIQDIDLIATTGGPGLIGGVLTSVMFAKGLSLANNIPFCAVNHLEGHALVARMHNSQLSFPFLLFLASGGHCQILVCLGVGKYIKYGVTIDDAIGEAFDKIAKILGLPYPGGPEIEAIAREGDMCSYKLPQAMRHKHNCDFSLSGLKTATKYLVDKFEKPLSYAEKANIAASFQYVVAQQIVDRLNNAMQKFKKEYQDIPLNLVFTGGVAANSFLRRQIVSLCAKHQFELVCPEQKLCTDNGVMIAWAGYENYQIGNMSQLDFKPKSRWPLYNRF